MRANEYVDMAMQFNDEQSTKRLEDMLRYLEGIKGSGQIDLGGVFHAALGMTGEAGEAQDIIKKWIFHEKELDCEHLQKELGDVMWYVALMCHSFGFDFEKILQMNYDKLSARYPDGHFDVYHANHRAEGDI